MDYPEITEDQREMAVVLLANALRKDAHLRDRAAREETQDDPLRASLVSRRAEPSRRYVDGMVDLLRALFPNGREVAAACLEEARARALRAAAPHPNGQGSPPRQ